MQETAEPSPIASAPRPALRVVTLDEPEDAGRDELIRRLAADRVRELRDDGLTLAYVARMYGVELDYLREVCEELGPGRLA